MKAFLPARVKTGTLLRVVALGLACAYLFPTAAAAQASPPLAEVAKKEAERRKGIKETQKVITTKDLPESARKPKAAEPTPATGGGAHAAAAGGAAAGQGSAAGPGGEQKPEHAGDAGDQKDEKYWRTRVTQANENLRRNESFAVALQSQINALTTDFVNRDDPYQRQKIGEDRQKALGELERVKSEIELSKKRIADLEEEARRAGVPPGWLR